MVRDFFHQKYLQQTKIYVPLRCECTCFYASSPLIFLSNASLRKRWALFSPFLAVLGIMSLFKSILWCQVKGSRLEKNILDLRSKCHHHNYEYYDFHFEANLGIFSLNLVICHNGILVGGVHHRGHEWTKHHFGYLFLKFPGHILIKSNQNQLNLY